MAGGFMTTQILYTAARLNVADRLKDSPMTSEDLAGSLGVKPQSLRRFLLMMTVLGLLTQTDEDRFELSRLGDLLRSDHPDSLRGRVLYIGEVNYAAAQGMRHAVETGETAFEHVFGVPLFDFLASRPDLTDLFHQQMEHAVYDRIAGVLSVYDFNQFSTIVDIGGGSGVLLAAILRANPRTRGILMDAPHVATEARTSLGRTDVASRIEVLDGDLFRSAFPKGGDLYLLSNVIHDWDDQCALQILRRCRTVVPEGGRLLLIEEILPPRAVDAPATIASDFSMLLLTGGKERTELEYQTLLGVADFVLSAVFRVPSARIYSDRKSNQTVLEARPD